MTVSYNSAVGGGTLTLSAAATASASVVVTGGSSYTEVLVNGKYLTRMNGVDSNSIATIAFTGNTGTDSLSVTGLTNTTTTISLTDVEKRDQRDSWGLVI